MNDHDHSNLATLLREDVTATEPGQPLDAMVPVRLGRRRLRSRRLRAAGATAALVALVGVVVPLATGGDHEAAPAAHGSTADQVRDLLEPSTGELPTPTVAVGPTGTTVTFKTRHDTVWHDYRVTSTAGVGLEDPVEHCREAMEERGYVSCSVERGPDGTTAVVQVLAVKPVGEVPADSTELGPVGDNIYARVPLSSLDAVDPRDRFFRREALVATPTGTVSVNEQVNAPYPPSTTAYVVPVGTLLEIAGELATHPGVFGSH
jgi:hypothetical protein